MIVQAGLEAIRRNGIVPLLGALSHVDGTALKTGTESVTAIVTENVTKNVRGSGTENGICGVVDAQLTTTESQMQEIDEMTVPALLPLQLTEPTSTPTDMDMRRRAVYTVLLLPRLRGELPLIGTEKSRGTERHGRIDASIWLCSHKDRWKKRYMIRRKVIIDDLSDSYLNIATHRQQLKLNTKRRNKNIS